MEKKNTGLIVLVIILSLLVVGLGGFIIYDKVFSNKVENTKDESNNVITENNQINQKENNNSSSVENTNDYDCISQNNIEVDYSKLFDMGSGIFIKSVSGSNYSLRVSSKGEIEYQNKENGSTGKINVKNVVDVVFHQYPGELNGEYYILTEKGQLYTITETSIASNNLEPIKDVVLGKVLKIGTFSTAKPGAGGGWGVYCVTADGNTIQLVTSSV